MLGDLKGKELLEFKRNYTVFDLETTGLSVVEDRIVEIGAIRVREGRMVDEFNVLVNPNWRL